MNLNLSLAPLQGITDFTFRKLICKHFKGINKVYTPFLRLQNNKTLKEAQVKDVLPKNNVGVNLIPQIICNNAEDFILLGNYLVDLGYQEVNWNLGCPYPMVAKRKLGSGLLPYSYLIQEVLEKTLPKIQCKVSVKVRSGYESDEDIFELLPVFNEFSISELIIHPRIAKQMYKGTANALIVKKVLGIFQGSVVYNGDIRDIDSFSKLRIILKEISHWMIGRALISNPFLVEELVSSNKVDSETKMKRFIGFYYDLHDFYQSALSGPGHFLNKMQHLWEYFSVSFTNGNKVWKMIKKSKSIMKYNEAVSFIFQNEKFAG